MCKYYTILCKGIEHPQMLVPVGGSWNQSLLDTKGQLYKLSFAAEKLIRPRKGTRASRLCSRSYEDGLTGNTVHVK